MVEQSENPVSLSDADLQKSYWFLIHRDPIKRNVTLIGAVISCLIFAGALIGGLRIVVFDILTNQSMKDALLKGRIAHISNPLVPELTIIDSGVLSHTDGTTDFYASITNPTTDWYVTFDVAFRTGDVLHKEVPLVLFPGDTRYALALAQRISSSPDSISSTIEHIVWKRMDVTERNILSQRRNFHIQNIVFIPYDSNRVDAPPFASLKFDLFNESVYGFWEVQIPIVVRDNSRVIGVSQVIVPHVKPREKRALDVRWTSDTQLAPRDPIIIIEPILQILQQDIYQPQEGVPQR